MALRIMQTRSGRDLVVIVDAANTTFAPSNASLNTANEGITGLTIRSVIAGVGIGGEVIIDRGGANVFRTAFSGTFDFAGSGQAITANATTNVGVSFVGANCTAQLVLAKQSNAVNVTY